MGVLDPQNDPFLGPFWGVQTPRRPWETPRIPPSLFQGEGLGPLGWSALPRCSPKSPRWTPDGQGPKRVQNGVISGKWPEMAKKAIFGVFPAFPRYAQNMYIPFREWGARSCPWKGQDACTCTQKHQMGCFPRIRPWVPPHAMSQNGQNRGFGPFLGSSEGTLSRYARWVLSHLHTYPFPQGTPMWERVYVALGECISTYSRICY